MRIACVGGGPAGLYFAIAMKLKDPSHEIVVMERNQPDDTFGWGVVFSDQTMENLQAVDPVSAQKMVDELAHWDDIDVEIDDGEKTAKVTSTGHGFIGIGRKRLLNILQERAAELGAELRYGVEVDPDPDSDLLRDFDLIIASDGLNSRFRKKYAEHFDVDIDVKRNHFVWLGTHQTFDAFKFLFRKTEHGWIWAHAYQFAPDLSTFIIECDPETFASFDFANRSQDETCRIGEEIFGQWLGGHKLMSNARHIRGSSWINFPRVICNSWHYRNIILLGDAAHTAHFSIGSGTKLAFEDAIKLAEVLNSSNQSLEVGLVNYREERQLDVLRLQSAARNSTEWFETLDRYLPFDPMQFTYSLLTRSQRVSHENLRLRDPEWLGRLEKWFAEKAGLRTDIPTPPMFTPFRLRDMELRNRIVVSPMATYSAVGGLPNDFHLVHYGARAMGGAALVYTEMTCVSPEGRITPGCAGMWNDEQTAAWKKIVRFVQDQGARMCLQLGHSGSKGSTRIGWEGMDEPLVEGNWPLIAASDVAWSGGNATPRPMTRADMDMVRDQFVESTRRAIEAGFDMVELHCAHGYLLSGFISPTQNRRTDEYGGSLENRLRYPLEVFRAMRAVWPVDKPMAVRISAHDWVGENGVTPREAVEISRAFIEAGVDLIDVSAGQVTKDQKPVYGRMFQTPFSDLIRNEIGCATMAVGNIYEVDHVNSILAAGRADLCALARPHLIDPQWTLRAAAEQRYAAPPLPPQYEGGYRQLATNLERAAQMAMPA